jgi:hypothetical protein
MAGEQQQVPAFGTRLLNLCKAVWQVTKRNSQLLSLKTRIEKLSRIDLRQAFADLGRRCYELKLNQDRLGTHYLEIEALEQRICEKKKGVHAEDGATAMNKLRAVAEDQASKMTAEALTLKLGGMMAEVGKVAAASGDAALPQEELHHVREIEASIEGTRKQMASIEGSSFGVAFRALFQRPTTDPSAKLSIPRTVTGIVGGVIVFAAVFVPVGYVKVNGESIPMHVYDSPIFPILLCSAAFCSVLFASLKRFGMLFIMGVMLFGGAVLFINASVEIENRVNAAHPGAHVSLNGLFTTSLWLGALLVLTAALPWFWKSKR